MNWKSLSLVAILFLGGCTYAEAFKMLTGMGSQGFSVDAQIGDRENRGTLGDSNTIGEIEVDDGDLNLDQSKAGFQGQANNVTINEAPWGLVLSVLLAGIVIGLFLPQVKISKK